MLSIEVLIVFLLILYLVVQIRIMLLSLLRTCVVSFVNFLRNHNV